MILYKFYKQGCHPCELMKKLMGKFDLPNEIMLMEVDVNDPENEDLVEAFNIDVVPVLIFPVSGERLVGVKSINVMKKWITDKANEIRVSL